MKRPELKGMFFQFHGKRFRQIFLIALLTVTLAAALSAFVSFRTCTGRLTDRAQSRASRIYLNLQRTLDAVQSNAVFLGSLNSVSRVLGNPAAGVDELKDVMEDICSFTGYSDYSSVELFFSDIERVYVSEVGLYTYDDYFDQEFLERLVEESASSRWVLGRSYSRYYGAGFPYEVMTYVRRLPLYAAGSQGYLTIQIRTSHLITLALDGAGREEAALTLWGKTILDNRSEDVWQTVRLEEDGISCSVSITRRQVRQAFRPVMRIILGGWLLLAVLSLLLAAWYEEAAGRPARELLRRLGVGEGDSADPDLYAELEEAINTLSGQVADLSQAMRRNRPLVREQTLQQLICQEGSLENRLQQCADCGIAFPYSLFAVILLDTSDLGRGLTDSDLEQMRVLCRERCLMAFGQLGSIYFAGGEGSCLIFLLNADGGEESLPERIRDCCSEVSYGFEGSDAFSLRFSAGLCDPRSPRPYRAYLGARRGLSYTSSDSEGFVAFSRQDEDASYADSRLVEEITRSIFRREPEQLDVLLERHRRWYLTGNLRRVRQAADLCLCSVYCRLLEGDYRASEEGFSAAARQLAEADTPEGCHEALRAYFHSLIHSHEKVSDRSYGYVLQAISYIESNYARNFAIPEMAEELGINPTYLNKVFKLAQGKTVSEYLNHHRIAMSLPMLQDKSRTIAEISAAVGYPDVRGFIRFFKKFYGVTPSEYRRQSTDAR